jgi:hypothetical protein
MTSSDPSFSGYLCWDPHSVGDTIKTDAASPAASTLLAVHHPGHIREASGGQVVGEESVAEKDVLHALLKADEFLTLVPVIGDSGTGKSHLIRWLRARLEGDDGRRLVYLPRSGTSLRGLIELLLDQLADGDDDAEALSLREELARAFGTANESQLPGRLLDAMARQLEEIADEPAEGKAGRRRRGLASQLPALLYDYGLRSFWLAEDGIIERFVKQATLGAPDDEDDDGGGFSFIAADLPDDRSIGDVNELGHQAREALRTIHSSQDMREDTAQLASEALNRAVPEVFGLAGSITLSQVFRNARAVLLARGEELVILIEDLTKLQGVDRELLNVMLDPVEEAGEQVLCTLRVAIAVTTGYYRSIDETFKTRAEASGTTFTLDAPFEESTVGWTGDELVDFASRYLNATRVGAAELEVAYRSAGSGDREGRTWIPSGCAGCDHVSTCHEAFGQVDGRGLYPFNRAALQTMAAAVLDQRFNPRTILKQVLFPVLAHHGAEIAAGRFPSRALERDFPDAVPLPATAATGAAPYPDRDRREVLLRFWAGNPVEVTDLAPGVHEAFRLPETGTVVDPEPGPEPDAGPSPDPAPEPDPVVRPPSGVEEWANGRSMPRADVDRVQQALYKGVLALVPWDRLGIQPRNELLVGVSTKGRGTVLGPRSIHIEDGLGVDQAKTDVVVRLDRSHKDLLLYLDQAGTSPATSLGFLGYDTLQRWMAEVADQVAAAIEARVDPVSEDSPVAALVGRLELGAFVLGDAEADALSTADPLQLAGRILSPAAVPDRADATAWSRLGADLADARSHFVTSLISLAEYRQGAATKPGLVRAGRIAQALRLARPDWSIARKLPVLPDAMDVRGIATREVKQAANDENERLDRALQDIRSLLGEAPWDGADLAERLADALKVGELADVFPTSPYEVRQFLDQLSRLQLEPIRRFAESTEGADGSVSDLLQRIGELRRLQVHQVYALLAWLDESYRLAAERAAARLADVGGGGAGTALDATIDQVDLLSSLLESLR